MSIWLAGILGGATPVVVIGGGCALHHLAQTAIERRREGRAS